MTTIVSCNCVSPFQDGTYGKGKRVANCGVKNAKCTVCGKVHDLRDSEREKKGTNKK